MEDLSTYIVTREVGKTIESSRLHAYLGVKTPHRKWIARRIESLGLIEGTDYAVDKIVRRATVKEYEVVFGDRSIRKPTMSNRQKRILGVFETAEGLKLEKAPDTVRGLIPICDSMTETASVLGEAFKKLGIGGEA